MTETFTVSVDNDKDNTRLVEEGKSRLTPFQAIFLFELGVSANCVRIKESQPTSLGRLAFINTLMKVEKDHPDWHFEDFKNWVRETTWDVEK